MCVRVWNGVLSAVNVAAEATAPTKPEPWTWIDAAKLAIFGLCMVFAILALLTLLTTVAGKLIMRYENQVKSKGSASGH